MKTAMLHRWNHLRHVYEPVRMAALALLVTAVLLAGWLVYLNQQTRATREAIATRRAAHRDDAMPVVRQIPLSEQVGEFIQALPTMAANTDNLERVFQSAQQHNLELAHGEYKLRQEVNDPLTTYTAILPVHGDYGAIRDFCADVLRALPNASLEELRMSRTSSDATALDAVVRFTFVYRR